MRWAQLLKRVFNIDIEQCPHCGGHLKLLAAIEEPAAIARILTHLGLAAQPPPRAGRAAGSVSSGVRGETGLGLDAAGEALGLSTLTHTHDTHSFTKSQIKIYSTHACAS